MLTKPFSIMAFKKKISKRSSRHRGYNKMKVRTERLKLTVRFALCLFVLTASITFLATTLKPYRELGKLREYYSSEVQELERVKLERLDEKEREYDAIEHDPQYLGLIARDRLHYYKPGEHVFRIER